MKPLQNGGIELETPGEKGLALDTLTTALSGFAPSINSQEAEGHFDNLATKIAENIEGPEAEHSLPIDADEKGVLREAVRAAELNLYFAMGVITCLCEERGLNPDDAVKVADKSYSPLLQMASVAIITGKAALEFSGLLDLYGTAQPAI